jgi:hypothetical protein
MRITRNPNANAIAGRDRLVEAASNWATEMVAEGGGTEAEWLGWLVGTLLENVDVDDLNAGIVERKVPVRR